MNRLVTIGIPVYNGARFFEECLESVVSQTYSDLEILIVDDGSIDDSLKIAEDYQSRYDFIKIIRNEKNLGLVGNWNKCLSLSNGDWVKLHFQDDLMEPETIEKMIQMSIDYDLNLVLTDREFFYEDEIKDQFVGYKKLSHLYDDVTIIFPEELASLLIRLGLNDNFLGEPIIGLVKKELLMRYGFYDDLFEHLVDFEYWLRISLNERVGFIPEALHKFRIHEGSKGSLNVHTKNEIVSIPDHDKMKLIHKLANDVYFERFRESVSKRQIDKLIKTNIVRKVAKKGYHKMSTILEPHLLSYVRKNKVDWIKSHIRDFF